MNTLRVAIIGAGGNARGRHIPGLQVLDGVEVVAVCNRSVASGERVAAEFGIPEVTTDWRALIEREDIDAIVISMWPYMHAPMTIAALDMGKHVLCEARMAMNHAEAREMLAAARSTDRVAQLVPTSAMFHSHRVLLQLLREDAIGQIREIYLSALASWHVDPSEPIHWRQRRDLSGVNTLFVGAHYEMLSRYFGYARTVSAQMSIWTGQRADPESGGDRTVDLPDTLQSILEMESGAVCVYRLSAVARHPTPSRVEVIGSEGSLVFDLESGVVRIGRLDDAEPVEVPVPAGMEMDWRVEADFVDSIRTGAPVAFTPFDVGVRYMEFTEAVLTSATTGQRVALTETV
jgi:predicted dehydrogenase